MAKGHTDEYHRDNVLAVRWLDDDCDPECRPRNELGVELKAIVKDNRTDRLEDALASALTTLNGIASSDWRTWGEGATVEAFEHWAKNRARHEAMKIAVLLSKKAII
jgi:hypothetical protein